MNPIRSAPREMGVTARWLFFGGKGGVGKTTCAAAWAVDAARHGRRVLLVSTDPAPSLGDALGQPLSARPRGVAGAGRRGGTLRAVEIGARQAFARWLARRKRPLARIVEQGTWLDRADVESLLALPIPGVDELVALTEIARLAGPRGGGPYDQVVVDTAPTGHTLRLLAAPAAVGALAGVLDALQEEQRIIRERFGRSTRRDPGERLIAELTREAAEMGVRLRQAGRVAFEWVLLPEELPLAETVDAFGALERAGIAVAGVIVNRVAPAGPPCPLCDRRRAAERRIVAAVARRLGRRRIRLVPETVREPRGVAALARVARATRRAPVAEGRRSSGRSPGSPGDAPPERLQALHGAGLLLFAGKGGVGKTTVAAAAAVRLARAEPQRRILLLSTDPAPSLADVLAIPVGDRLRRVPGTANLDVRELDAARVLASRRVDLEAALLEIATTIGAGQLREGEPGSQRLIDLAPPGIDELLAILSVSELLTPGPAAGTRPSRRAAGRPQYDLLMVDLAPTGHALRLLEMPDAARRWAQTLLRVLLKYRALARPGRLAEELVVLSRGIRRLQALLHDPSVTRVIVVTRAAELPRQETGRLAGALRRLGLSSPALVVNALTREPGVCPHCRRVALAERRELAGIRRRWPGRSRECAIILAPLVAPPPRGRAALDRWGGEWSA